MGSLSNLPHKVYIASLLLLSACGSENLPDINKYLEGNGDATGEETTQNPTPTDSSNQNPNDPQPTDPTPPNPQPSTTFNIRSVSFSGFSWTVAPWELRVGSGEQLSAMPFDNINTITLSMNKSLANVTNVMKDNFLLSGKNTGPIEISNMNIDALNDVLRLSFATSLEADWYTLLIKDDFSLTDGTKLDGEWTNPRRFESTSSSTFPSGNGENGGDFEFLFGVLPGNVVANDETSNLLVTQEDVTKLNDHILDEAPYSQIFDINGDGVVNSSVDMAKIVEYSREKLRLDQLP